MGPPASLAKQLVDGMSDEHRQRFVGNLSGMDISIGTLCSGTDLCIGVLRGVMDFVGGSVTHVFSCDSSGTSQQWILNFVKPPPCVLYEDVTDLHSGGGFCIRTQSRRTLPAVDIIFMGFSCKDVSRLNIHASRSHSCIREKSLRTGTTLSGGMSFVQQRRPAFVFMENVAALADASKGSDPSNVDALVGMFGDLGYLTISAVYDARRHGSPQRRPRWWGVAVRLSDMALSAETITSYDCSVKEMMRVLGDLEMEPASLDSILMPCGSADLAEWMREEGDSGIDDSFDGEGGEWHRNQSQRVPGPSLFGRRKAKWVDQHAEHFRSHGLRYPTMLEMHYNEQELAIVNKLPQRSREIILFWDLSQGRATTEMVLDLSQGIGRVPRCDECLTCVLPRGALWLRKRFRLVQPNECLVAQGLPLYTKAQLSSLSRAELLSLAGNAFNAHTAMAFVIAAFTVFPFPGI